MKRTKWKHPEWREAFQPLWRRILLRHMLRYLSLGVIAALGSVLLIFFLSFLTPVENLWKLCLLTGFLITAATAGIGWRKRPSQYQAARIIDRMGLQEKAVTAYELEARDDPMAVLQRQDAVRSLSCFDKRRISLRMPAKHRALNITLSMALIIINLIPNPMDEILKRERELKAEIKEQLEELKESEEKLTAEEALTEEQRLELSGLLAELSEGLKNTENYKEALKEISAAEEKLSALADRIRDENIGRLAEHLALADETKGLAEALSGRDLAGIERELESLKSQLEQSDKKDELAKQLKEAMKKAAEIIKDEEIKGKLMAAADSLSKDQPSAAVDQLGDIMNQAVNAGNAMGDARFTLQQMRSRIARAAGEAQYAQNTGSSGQTSQGGERGQGTGQGESRGQGSGIGEGSSNESSGGSNSDAGGSPNGEGRPGQEAAEKIYEKIYDPTRLGDGGEITNVPGQHTGSGEIITEKGERGLGDFSGYIPYREVYQEYKSEAMKSMDRRSLPPSIQTMVREYFEELD